VNHAVTARATAHLAVRRAWFQTGCVGLDLEKTPGRTGQRPSSNEALPNDTIGGAAIGNCLIPWAVSRDVGRKLGEAAAHIFVICAIGEPSGG
jgi:hypothetical protein